jgi:peptidyl-Asp metalloendopeptidase
MRSLALFAILPLLSAGDFSMRPSDVLRSRLIRLDPSALTGETLRLGLFGSEAVEAVRENFVSLAPDAFTWVGHARGDETSSIVISVVRGSLSASIRLTSAQYRIRPQGGGLYRVEEVAPSSEPSERLPLSSRGPTAPAARADFDNGSDLDLLVVYTPRARRAAGGVEAIASLVGLGIAEANVAFEKSEIETRLRLVELAEVSFVEAGRVESDLEILRDDRDGALDEVHGLRDLHGADVVQLVVEEGDGCGIAYSMGRAGAAFSEWAFSVVERSCIDSTYAMAHELGHNLGCDHAPEDPTTSGAFVYSFGYKDLVAGFRTIMAYGPGRRVARFSNPRVLFGGVPTGTALQDNARSLNELGGIAARFRRSLPPPRVSSLPGPLPGTTRLRISSDGPRVLEWRLVLGTSFSAGDVLDSGFQAGEFLDVPSSALENARYARLWYRRGSVWNFEDVSWP